MDCLFSNILLRNCIRIKIVLMDAHGASTKARIHAILLYVVQYGLFSILGGPYKKKTVIYGSDHRALVVRMWVVDLLLPI